MWLRNFYITQIYQFGDDFGNRSEFYKACREFGSIGGNDQWRMLSFRFDLDNYLERLRRAQPQAAHGFEQSLSDEFKRRAGFGIDLCAPVSLCFSEFGNLPGTPRRALGWWHRRPNLTAGDADVYLCRHLLSAFITREHLRHPGVVGTLLPPSRAECSMAFADAGVAWTGDREAWASRSWSRRTAAASVAVCIRGGVRSFTHQAVHLSFRENVVRALNASYLRVFFVLNLTSDTCSWDGMTEVRRFTEEEVRPALEASCGSALASLTVEPACCWPELTPGLRYEDCFADSLTGPVVFRATETCDADIALHERAHGVTFDWVLVARPDLIWQFPIGDIRWFALNHVHAPKLSKSELSDLFALVPRGRLRLFAAAFRDPATNGSTHFCLTERQAADLRMGTLCDLPGYPLCQHCWFGSHGCVLELHLRKHRVKIGHIPEEIAVRTPRWMHVAVGSVNGA